MRRLLGTSLLVAAGCAVQPDAENGEGPVAALVAPLPPKAALSARVGVEYVPDAGGPATAVGIGEPLRARLDVPRFGARAEGLSPWAQQGPGRGHVEVEPAPRGSPPRLLPPESPEEPRTWLPWLNERELAAIEDPAERLTLQFMNYLIGEDRRRVQRHLGTPVLFDTWRNTTPTHGSETELDRRNREDRALLLSREHAALLNRPFRKALRNTFLRDFELMFDDIKSSIPWSGGGTAPSESRDWGRLSFRAKVNNQKNPLEVSYYLQGWRIGTNQQTLKFDFERQLSEKLWLSLRSRYYYGEHLIDMWGDVHYRVDADTSIHVLTGNKMDITSGAAMLPVIHSPIVLRTGEESPGVMFYVEHIF